MSAELPLVVVDASVAVKLFNAQGEDGVAEAEALLDRHLAGELRLVGPTLLVHEVHHAVTRRRIDASALDAAMEAFFDMGVTLLGPDRRLMLRANAHMFEAGVSSADSIYAALAETLGCELVTADRRLARALEGRVATIVV